MNLTVIRKCELCMLILGILSGIAGAIVWVIIRNIAFNTPAAGICFTGYPIVLSCIFVYIYSCRHNFHEKAAVK